MNQPVLAGPGVITGAYWTASVAGDFNVLVVADLNHDGWSEILGGTDEGQVFVWSASGQPLWEFQVETDWVSGISTSDLDGDGSDEVLVTANGILPTSYLYILRADGSLWWSHTVRDELWAALPINLDNDPSQELLLAARRPAVLDTNGAEIPGWPVALLRTPHIRLVDWDGDAIQDIVTLTPGSLNILNVEGASLTRPLTLPGEIQAVEAGDVDGDGTIELAVLTDTALVLVNNDGGIRWKSPQYGTRGTLHLTRKLSDMSGAAWIVLSGTTGIAALDENGHEQWKFDAGLPGGQAAVLAARENLLMAGTSSGQAYLLDSEGHQLAEYDLEPPISHAKITDLNGDGYLEVLLVSGGTLNAFSTPAGGREIRVRWNYIARTPVVTLAKEDVDGDKRDELLLVERNSRLTLLDRKGTLVWQHIHEDPPDGWVQDGFGGFVTWAGANFHRHNDQGAILWESQTSGAIRAIIPAFGGLATLTDAGQITLYTIEDGSPIWTANLDSLPIDLAATEAGLAIAQDDAILLLNDTGALLWQTRLNRSIQEISPIPGGGIIARSPGHLSWLDTDGMILWNWEAQPAERITSLDISSSLVAVGTDARAIILDRNGAELWSHSFDEVISAVTIVDVDSDGFEETVIGTVRGSVVLLSSEGDEIWRDKGRERVNVLATADLNADGLPEILAGFEDGVVTVYGLELDQPPWLGEPAVAAVGDGYQYAVQVRDTDAKPVGVTLEIWDPSAYSWISLGSATASTGNATLTWNVPNPFNTWDSQKDSAFRFIWKDGQGTGTTAAFPGPLRIPVAPWYVTYGRVAGLAVFILAAPILLTVIIRRTRIHRRSPLGQAEAALLRLRLDPDETIREFHRLLSDEFSVLLLNHMPGLAREAGEAALGDLLEGSHLALTRPEVMAEALRTITDALQRLEKLPLAGESKQFYSLLLDALLVDSITQIVELRAALDNMAESVRPKGLYQAPAVAGLNQLASVARTLRASEQVEATGDRIAYLAEALADLNKLERDIEAESISLERQTMIAVSHHWLELISETLERLRGRAEIDLRLRTRQLVLQKDIILGLTLANTGRSPATDLAIEVITGARIVPLAERTFIDVLSPNASRRLELALRTTSMLGSFEVTFRVTWDDREKAGKEAIFSDHVRLIPKPSQFQPIPNPYATGRPLVPGSPVFVGREDVFAFVKEKITEGQIVVLVGERRMGKTSLMRQLSSQMGDAWVVAYLDGQGLGVEGGLENWLADAGLEISRATGYHASLAPAELSSQPGPTFEAFLEQVSGGLDERRRLLVLLDEFEEIEERVSAGDLPPSIFPYLRHLMQFGEAGFLLAGTKRLERLSPKYWTPLFNIGLYREVGPLDDASARKLIHEPVDDRLIYDDLAVDKLLRLSGCQPYFLQLLCHALVTHCNRERIAYATSTEVGVAEKEAISLGEAHLRFLWEGASTEGQAVLSAIAETITRGELGTAEAIAARFKSVGHHQDNTRLPEILQHLTNLGLVNRSTDGRFRFSADLVRSWIQRTRRD